MLKGKFRYMSPEQARGERVDRRSDIYALGVVLYEMLTLRSPYDKQDDDALLRSVQTCNFEPPSAHAPDLPPEVEALVLRAMARAPADRYQTARDLAGAIARVLLAKQELVDNASVETTLTHLLGRDQRPTNPDALRDAQQQTMAAVPLARMVEPVNEAGTAAQRAAPRAVREVRHVAVVTLRLRGVEDLEEAKGPLMGPLRGAAIRAILDEIAYKRHAVWSWDAGPASVHPGRPHVGVSARAIVGLLDNPSRAAADAAWLAVDAHEALAGACEDFPVKLHASIGIVRGIATGERDAQGHLVHHTLQEPANVLADRVSQGTPFGKTWVAGGVFRLVRRDFRWGDAPPISIVGQTDKDAPRQMRLYALERPLTREEQQDELTLAPNDLVGRDAEKADLSAAFHRAANPGYDGEARPQGFDAAEEARPAPTFLETDGAPSTRISIALPSLGAGRTTSVARPAAVVVASASPEPIVRGELIARAVVGEMGIGKTALVKAFLAELPAEARVVAVECSPVQSELPLATVSDLLRNISGAGLEHSIEQASAMLTDMLGGWARSKHTPRITARLAELVTGKQLEHGDEDAVNYRRDLVLLGVRALLGNLARSAPVVVVIDGLQWADRPSLELLQSLLSRKESRPILVLLVTRPDDRVAPFLEGMVRIELRGLSADEQIRLVEARLGVRTGVAAVCRELVPRVAGNPFFLLEMIDALLERGTLEIVDHAAAVEGGEGDAGPVSRGRMALVRHERAAGGSEPLPSTLEQIIGDRLRELPPAEHDIVDWLAVAGGPLLENDLIALARLADDESVTRLCARGVCDRKTGSVDFRHPLARDVAYSALDAPSRVRMHRRLGEHLAQTPLAHGLSAAIVARHLARGEDPSAAAELYIEAGNAARSGHQAPLAQRYYQRALTLLPASDSRRMLAHEALEAIYRNLGRRRERRSHLTALRKLARESGQARWAALALVRTARLDLDEGYLGARPPGGAARDRGHPHRQEARARGRGPDDPERDPPRARRHPRRHRRGRARAPGGEHRRPRGAGAGRGAPRQGRAPPLRRPCQRGGRGLRRGHRRLPHRRRAKGRGPRQELARVRDVRARALRGRHRRRPLLGLDRSRHRRPLPDRQDAEQRRPGLRAPRRHRARPGLPQARPRRARALRRSGLARRHLALHRGHPHRGRRHGRGPHAGGRRGRAHRRDRERLRSRPRAHRAGAARARRRGRAARGNPRGRGAAADRVAGAGELPRLRHGDRGGGARPRARSTPASSSRAPPSARWSRCPPSTASRSAPWPARRCGEERRAAPARPASARWLTFARCAATCATRASPPCSCGVPSSSASSARPRRAAQRPTSSICASPRGAGRRARPPAPSPLDRPCPLDPPPSRHPGPRSRTPT